MNTMHKILLAIVIVTANNDAFTSEQKPTDTTVDKSTSGSTTVTLTAAEKYKAQQLIKKATALELETLEKKQEELSVKLKAAGKNEKDCTEDTELLAIKKAIAAAKIADEKAAADEYVAWEEAKPWLATAYKYAVGVGCGGFLITKFELTGSKATFVKGVSLVTAVAATLFIANKTYEYFFKEEVENEEEL